MNQQEKSGKVFLVGAGPSDPGLFTLKGKQVLESAEVVVYDALAGQGILNMIPDTAEAINVGKRANHHIMPQEQISRLLVQKAQEGKRVVRLKGGDPFLFGRGGEEIEELIRAGIPFEVVPGVTSAFAVPAYQGIPVTHRDFCSSVHIITGHKRTSNAKRSSDDVRDLPPTDKEGALPKRTDRTGKNSSESTNISDHRLLQDGKVLNIDFEALVRTKGTLVFLMGVSALGDICQGLLLAGMNPDTPAALLMQGTTAHQRRIVATVSTLEEEVRRQGSCTPAIIVVGEVCTLAEQFSWADADHQPLGGVKVLLTRPKELISETAAKLRAKGAEVLELPAIRTERVPHNERLSQALIELDSYQWIVFTSPTGVRIFFEEMAERGIDCRALRNAKFAVIGNGTKKALAEHGFYADLMPDVYDAQHLGRALRDTIDFGRSSDSENKGGNGNSNCMNRPRILIPRAALGSPELIGELGDGFLVDDIPTYETRFETSRFVDLQKEFADGTIDYVMFTSASTVRGFADAVRDIDYAKVNAVCIGKQTEAAAKEFGMKTYVAKKASIDSLIECLCELRQKM
ncbi:MAG: uroporphyrinogen-III C-methyltransferase [Lachnospiraceae bacterium]|nr:uroporphyrinogen-III C-methyltransferase [Lachnospiraceae bacterium]